MTGDLSPGSTDESTGVPHRAYLVHLDADRVGRGPPVVLLHGVGFDRRAWCPVASELARRYHVTCPDLRGHGSSPAAEADLSLEDLAEDVRLLVDEPAHVVGWSLGAMVAQQLALDHPEAVRSVTLVSPVGHRSPEQRAAVLGRLAAAEQDWHAAAAAAVDRWFQHPWSDMAPDLPSRVLEQLRSLRRDSYLACYRVFARGDERLWPRLPSLAAPVLAVTGEHDTGSTPAMSREIAARVRSGAAVVIEGVGHLLPLEAPAPLLALLEEHLTGVGGRLGDDARGTSGPGPG